MDRLASATLWAAVGKTLVDVLLGKERDSEVGITLMSTGGLVLIARAAANPRNRPRLLGLGVGVGVGAMFGVAVVPRLPSVLLTASAIKAAHWQRRRLLQMALVRAVTVEVTTGVALAVFGMVVRGVRETPTLGNAGAGARLQALGIGLTAVGVMTAYPNTGVIEFATLAGARAALATAGIQ